MPQLIVFKTTSQGLDKVAPWPRLDSADDGLRGPVLVSLGRWMEAGPGDRRGLSVWANGDADPATWAAFAAAATVSDVPVVALHLAAFNDGRAYSLARRLRRAGYAGDLRATGDVLVDQVRFLARVGFTSFEMPETTDPRAVEAALGAFPDVYQPAADGLAPVAWRRAHKPTDRRSAAQ